METAEAMRTGTSKSKVILQLIFILPSMKRLFTWVCMAQRVEGGCEGPGGLSSWWGFLKVWLNRYLGFGLASGMKIGNKWRTFVIMSYLKVKF